MRQLLELQYACRVIQWDEQEDDCALFSAIASDGSLICAQSLALFISALQDVSHQPLRLAA